MSIVASEIIWRKSAVNDDTSSNGGRMTATTIADDVKNNLWPDVPQAERTAGSTKYRKAHCHIANDTDLPMLETRLFVETFTPGDDSVTIFTGTAIDTQSGVTGSERLYGSGQLNADLSAAATSCVVDTEDAALDYYQIGDLVRISDKTDVDDGAGNEEYVTLTGVSAYTGDQVTLSFSGDPLANGYLAASTRVASVIEVGTVQASADNLGGSYTGTFDINQVAADSIGTVEDTITLTFSDATNYSIVGTFLGSLGSGTVGGGASPTNNDYSKPYFVIDPSAFGGTFTASDTVTFDTHPCSIPVWLRRDVPAGASSLSANKVIVAVDGESS